MIKLNMASVKAGMRLAKSISTTDGKLLIDAGIPLKHQYIEKLCKLGIQDIHVDWDQNADGDLYDVFFQDTKREMTQLVEESFKTMSISKSFEINRLKVLIRQLIEDLSYNKETMVYLTDIRNIDVYTFGHCINVCIFSLMMGILLDLSQDELVDLGVGALLHDIGKIAVSQEVLKKPSSLDPYEYEEIKTHSIRGYEIIKNIEGISKSSCHVVRHHHERFNGKGYPDGLKGSDIHLFSRIVAICDVYDALTSNRVYKKKITPHFAVEYLVSMGGHEFDYELVKLFIKHITVYPVGTLVKFNTGESAEIIKINESFPTRPVVWVKFDQQGEPIEGSRVLDLTKHLYINIEQII
ncbi:HD-GYP domain-containing protein [Alkaliphilus hydrothermalis]|uniref:HD-GYP domain-containing protein (C-di-GMP phosphodiesterase class II) n=1 Tax=Alkaliphilus hydrothermalis TaxID=1482730 RepID=A0ABS2NMN4_9FIRM|nr:HD-GYP domain-containing protein [Alkaliphilus hydrothermalis]MBM7614210.1 HD-GYP domain-containing protein (c-di-GMP phosphodiesterase class II) [Alkaliphilus hydrothermalis]